MRGRSILALGILVLLIAVAGLTLWGVSYTNSPDFCDSCHIIKPYRDAWEKSVMGQLGVECVDCHFEPGILGYMRGKVYSLMKLTDYWSEEHERPAPSAELLTNSACLQCHAEIADSDNPEYPDDLVINGGIDLVIDTDDGPVPVADISPIGGGAPATDGSAAQYQYEVSIKFPHDFHVNEAQKKCAECHSAVAHGTELIDRPQAALDPEYCNTCHDNKSAPIIFGDLELSGREHPGAPKIDTAIWKSQHWRLTDAPGTIDGGEVDASGEPVVYEQIERQTCLACHEPPSEAKACRSCHFPSIPSFEPTNEAQQASAAPLAMFGLVIGTYLVTMVPYPKVKRYIFEGWIAALLALIVLVTDFYAVYKVMQVVIDTTEGSRDVGPVALWIAYIMASASLLIFLFHQGVLKPRRRRLSGDD